MAERQSSMAMGSTPSAPVVTAEVPSAGRVRAVVDVTALQHNLRYLRALAPGTRIMAVVKADGYGHGAATVAAALGSQADSFAVAAISEGVALREAGVGAPICVLGGVQDAADWDQCLRHALQVVVHARWQWEQLQQRAHAPQYWIKLDTGMGRLGFNVEEWAQLQRQPQQHPQQCQGLMTHLACADQPAHPLTRTQLARLAAAQMWAPDCPVSIANSAALLAWPETRRGVVRPGLALYGVNPLADARASGNARGAEADVLRPALALEARVMAVRPLRAGDCVGYGGEWRAPADTRIAVIAAGYADGVPRCLGGTRFHLRDHQQRALPLRGRISMDMLTVELPATSTVRAGDWLGVWGGSALPVSEVAALAGTIPYELLTALGGRVAHGLRRRS